MTLSVTSPNRGWRGNAPDLREPSTRIEQQNALTRPAFEIAMIRAVKPGIVFSSSLYIFNNDGGMQCRDERKMPDHAPVPVRDKVLAENHHFNVTQLGKAERVKTSFCGG